MYEDICKMYSSGLSVNQIANNIKKSRWYVQDKLKKCGVKPRSISESVHLSKGAKDVEVDNRFYNILDGIILSDGYLGHTGVGSRLQLIQSEKNREWVELVEKEFNSYGIEYSILQKEASTVNIKGKIYRRAATYGLRTRSYSFLDKQRTRWYVDGKKIIPLDLIITPLTIYHWYCGDGTVGCKGYHAKFCTDGFTEYDIKVLIKKMEGLGFRPIIGDRNRILLSTMLDRKLLLKMVSGLPSCFAHKEKLIIETKNIISTPEVKAKILKYRSRGMSYNQIAKQLGVSKSGVYAVAKSMEIK